MAFKKVAAVPKAAKKPQAAKPAQRREAPPEESRAPVHKISLYPVEAAIWQNFTEDGRSMYSVTFQRSYKTREGEWKRSTSFSGTDLLVLSECATQAYHAIDRARKDDRAQEVREPEPTQSEVTDDDVPF